MLSALSSFLPSTSNDKVDKLDLRTDIAGRMQQAEDRYAVKPSQVTEYATKKEKKKKTSSYETFIVVRPPPAKSNHPLNLQLQLVPPHASRERPSTATGATPTRSHSVDQSQTPDSARPPSTSSNSNSDSEHGIIRSTSIRSNRSDAPGFYASTTTFSSGSVTSFASTASSASGRRIIPLYNLSAHNVMTNTILDAGTDARVAKFHKRGLELIDLGILEPIEVWLGKEHAQGASVYPASNSLGVPTRRSSAHSSLAPPGLNGSRAGTPDPSQSPASSGLSISDHEHGVIGYQHPSEPNNTPTASPSAAKKIFGKIFRKREGNNGGGNNGGGGRQPSSGSVSRTTPSRPRTAASPERRATTPTKSIRPSSSTEVLLPAVLGLSPTLCAAMTHPTGRCITYVWCVRKWLKVDAEGQSSGVLGKIGREASAHGIGNASYPDGGDWDVRFEWVRGKSKSEKTNRASGRTSLDAGTRNHSLTPSRRHSTLVGSDVASHLDNGLAISVDSPRTSLDKRSTSLRGQSPRRDVTRAVSCTSTNPSDSDTTAGHGEVEYDSDPEDSETPWTCSMILAHSSTLWAPQPASESAKGHSRTRTVSNIGAPSQATHTLSPSMGDNPPSPASIKVKVATLSPAPHHPKVVCQLKIPFPLPDAEVARGVLRKRVVLADGTTRSTVPSHRGPGPASLTLTAEEIKDVVCSTAFWVIVREGFGGVGKKSRKGDGWRIRG